MKKMEELLAWLDEEFHREFKFTLLEDGETISARMYFRGTEPEEEEYDCRYPMVFIGQRGVSFESNGWTKLKCLSSNEREDFLGDFVCAFGYIYENIY